MFEAATLFGAEEPATVPAIVNLDRVVSDPPVDIFQRAVVLQLQFRRLGISRKVSTDLVEVNTDKALLSVTKRILESDEYDAIRTHDGETARFVDTRKAGPAFANQGGFHLIPFPLKGQIDTWLDQRLDYERPGLVLRFVDVFDDRFDETQRRLGVLGNVKRPTREEVAAAFGVTRRYLTFGLSDGTAADAWRNEALGECRAVLREAFADVVSHLAERLEPGDGGKSKTFRDSLVRNFDDFVTSFQARDLSNDSELADLVAQARRIMAGVDAKDLRQRATLRAAVGRSMASIKAAVDALVIDKPTRFYGDE